MTFEMIIRMKSNGTRWLFQVSTGKIDMQESNENDELVITTNLHVANCKNLNVTAKILGTGASLSSQLSTKPYDGEIYGDKLFESKSFALIYAHNETRSMDRLFKIGQRQPNDTLLTFDEITANNELDSFPQCEIEYNDPDTVITQIAFKFNVSVHYSIQIATEWQCKKKKIYYRTKVQLLLIHFVRLFTT